MTSLSAWAWKLDLKLCHFRLCHADLPTWMQRRIDYTFPIDKLNWGDHNTEMPIYSINFWNTIMFSHETGAPFCYSVYLPASTYRWTTRKLYVQSPKVPENARRRTNFCSRAVYNSDRDILDWQRRAVGFLQNFLQRSGASAGKFLEQQLQGMPGGELSAVGCQSEVHPEHHLDSGGDGFVFWRNSRGTKQQMAMRSFR